jgi:hypothetical protein
MREWEARPAPPDLGALRAMALPGRQFFELIDRTRVAETTIWDKKPVETEEIRNKKPWFFILWFFCFAA